MKQITEREKYELIWSKIDYSSRTDKTVIIPHIEGNSVLDVGCGDNSFVKLLRTIHNKTAHGCDIASNAVKYAKEHFTQADAGCLPFMCQEFDTVTSCDFLEHIPPNEVDSVISELKRVGGKQVHVICTDDDNKYFGYKVHLSVRPIEWWRDKFAETDVIIERKLK